MALCAHTGKKGAPGTLCIHMHASCHTCCLRAFYEGLILGGCVYIVSSVTVPRDSLPSFLRVHAVRFEVFETPFGFQTLQCYGLQKSLLCWSAFSMVTSSHSWATWVGAGVCVICL